MLAAIGMSEVERVVEIRNGGGERDCWTQSDVRAESFLDAGVSSRDFSFSS